MSKKKTKIIRITSCEECPHRDHKGSWGSPAYVPCCNLSEGRELPHKVKPTPSGHSTYAEGSGKIPSWCELETLK